MGHLREGCILPACFSVLHRLAWAAWHAPGLLMRLLAYAARVQQSEHL